MWINRKYESTFRKLYEQFPIVIVTGARQVGKTSLVRKIFPDYAYVSLDLPGKAEQAENNPSDFLKSYTEPLIIDEVQYAPAIFRYLKNVVDQDKRAGRFVLTGSQNFMLMQNVSESLAGRCGILNMYNLSYREVIEKINNMDDLRYLVSGGFPELYTRPEIETHFWYASYLSTYLERDVRNILNIGSLRDFERFIRAVAMRTSNILSYSELARDVGISPNTAKSWISVLEASGQVFLLEPYYRNLGKRLIKSPKIYMCDTGLAAFLMGFESISEIFNHPAFGALWETHVVMQVIKYFISQGKRLPVWFWQTVHGAEVDLLIEKAGHFNAIEIKASERPDKKSLKGINALKKFYGDNSILKAYIACRTRAPYPLAEDVQAVPGSQIDTYLLTS